MQKKKIKIHIIKEGKLAKRYLRRFIRKGAQEKLRKFRVEIKKLRAVTSLIEETTPLRNVRRELKPTKETYQLSGQVRDSYLHVQLAKELPEVQEKYLTAEKLAMKKATRKLRKRRSHHLKMLKSAGNKLVKRVPKVKNKNISRFYERELLEIEGCLIASIGVEQMHGCRKRLKVLLYNLPLVGGILSLPVNEDYLQQVQTAIGDWHDHVLAAEQFPELGDKSEELLQEMKILTEGFYERATTVTNAPIKKKAK